MKLDLTSEHLECDEPIFANAAEDAASVLSHNSRHMTDLLRDSENKAIVAQWLKEQNPDPASYRVGEELRIENRVFMVMKVNAPTEFRRKGWIDLKETTH